MSVQASALKSEARCIDQITNTSHASLTHIIHLIDSTSPCSFDEENIRRVQSLGGCEGLFNSHMSDVFHHRRIKQDKHYEILQRSIYLFHLRELGRVVKETSANYTFSTVKKKVKKKSKKKKLGVSLSVDNNAEGEDAQLKQITSNRQNKIAISSPAKIVPV